MKNVTYNENECRLVPVAATEEQLRAMTEAFSLTDMDGIYRAALESSPIYPTEDISEDWFFKLTPENQRSTAHRYFLQGFMKGKEEGMLEAAPKQPTIKESSIVQSDAARDADARDAARWRELNVKGALDARGEFLRYVAKEVVIPSMTYEGSPEKVAIEKYAVYEARIRWQDGSGYCDTLAKFIDASIAAGRGEAG